MSVDLLSMHDSTRKPSTYLPHKPLFLLRLPLVVGIKPVTVLIVGLLIDLSPVIGYRRIREDVVIRSGGFIAAVRGVGNDRLL
jgi:hypothetical protein